jgi:hypothetical protein
VLRVLRLERGIMSYRMHKGRCRSVFDPTLAIIFDYFVLAARAALRWKPLSAEKKAPRESVVGRPSSDAALKVTAMRDAPFSQLQLYLNGRGRPKGRIVWGAPEQRRGHCHAIVRKPTVIDEWALSLSVHRQISK